MLFFPVSLLCWNDEIDYRDVSSVVGGGTEHGTTANVLVSWLILYENIIQVYLSDSFA